MLVQMKIIDRYFDGDNFVFIYENESGEHKFSILVAKAEQYASERGELTDTVDYFDHNREHREYEIEISVYDWFFFLTCKDLKQLIESLTPVLLIPCVRQRF